MKYLLIGTFLGFIIGSLASKVRQDKEVEIKESFNNVEIELVKPPQSPWTGDRYEYTNVLINIWGKGDEIKQLGLNGWELVAVTDGGCRYFKRRIAKQ